MQNETTDDKNVPQEAVGLVKLSKQYSEMYVLRAAIQGIPYVGGSLDTLLAGVGGNWQVKRLEQFIKDLTQKLKDVGKEVPPLEPSEPLYDFVVQVFDGVIRTRSEEKRKRFANIVAKQVHERKPWEEAEAASRFLSELTEQHIEVLVAAVKTPVCEGKFQGLRAVKIKDALKDETPGQQPTDLRKLLPHLTELSLRMYCSELAARGLLHDEGIGRYNVGAFEYFVPTTLADWFVDWISNIPEKGRPNP